MKGTRRHAASQSLLGHVLGFQIVCLLGTNLVLKIGNMLFGFRDVDRDGEEFSAVGHGLVGLGHGVVLLQGLQGLDLLKQLV